MTAPVNRCMFFALALVSISAASAQPPQAGAPQKIEIREIKVIGCVHKAAAARCVLLVSLDGERMYSFVAAPKPELGTIVTIQGAAHRGPAVCKQGIEIDVADWEPTGEKCAE